MHLRNVRTSSVLVAFAAVVGCGGGAGKGSSSHDAGTQHPGELGDASSAGSGDASQHARDGDASSTTSGDAGLSGTRLQALYARSADGLEIFERWHDTKLDVDCAFERMSDGELHCIPNQYVGSVVYTDDKCATGALNFIADPCDMARRPPELVMTTSGSSCGAREIRRVQDKLPDGTPWYFENDKGECTSGGMGLSTLALYALSASLPPSEFVKARVVEEPAQDGLGARHYQAEDGALQLVDYYDAKRNAPCSPRMADDGKMRCLPYNAGNVDIFFADGMCATSAAPIAASDCAQESGSKFHKLLARDSDTCQVRTEVYEVGAAIDHPFWKTGMMCSDASYATSATFAEVGAKIPGSELPALSTKQRGGTRLVADVLYQGDLPPLPSYAYFDTQLGVSCSREKLADGSERCVPAHRVWELRYTDAMCTKAVATADPCFYDGKVFLLYHQDENGCNRTHHVFEIGAQSQTYDKLYMKDPITSDCVAAPASSEKYATVGAEIPLHDLAQLTVGP